jgi:hypothetical protein
MLTRTLAGTTMAGALAIIAACSTGSDANAPAAQTAALYVTLDTLGDRGAADTLLAGCNDDPSDPEIAPTTYVTVGKPARDSRSDTVRVQVVYEVLGNAHPEDGSVVGPLYWRFTSAPSVDTVLLSIAPDTAGRMWIACGDFHPNHPMMGELTQAVKLMDSVSLHELELARVGKPSARKESQ